MGAPPKAGATPLVPPFHAYSGQRGLERVQIDLKADAGRAAFLARTEDRSNTYSFEQREPIELGDAQLETFRANAPAWAFFQSQPPSYRKAATWWVISAKRAETRDRRLATLIDDSAAGRRIRSLTPLAARSTRP